MRLFLILFITIAIFSCSNEPLDFNECTEVDTTNLNETQLLFYDIAYNQEFGNDSQTLRKWNQDISVFVSGSPTEQLLSELENIISTINNQSSTYFLEFTEQETESDLIVFFGTSQDYVTFIEPETAGFAEGSRGFTAIFWDNFSRITRASVCIDHINFPDFVVMQHVIREELAQSLGLINDTFLDDTSIFHQNIQNQNYSETDLTFIGEMLSNNLFPGICPNEALQLFQ